MPSRFCFLITAVLLLPLFSILDLSGFSSASSPDLLLARALYKEDFNGDGRLNLGDVIELLLFQRALPTHPRADYNGDGQSNIADALTLLLAQWQGVRTPLEEEESTYLASWSFDETGGPLLHEASANAFHGRVYGALWSEGISGGALEFDGIDDYVEITDGDGYPDSIGELSVGTISVWFEFDTYPEGGNIQPIFYLGDGIGGSGNSSLIIEIGHFRSGNSKLYFTVLKENVIIPLCFDSRINLKTNTWYHFAAVVGPNYNTGYLNGEEMIDRHYNFGDASVSCFFKDVVNKRVCWLGRGFLGGIQRTNYFKGKIDEIRIYDRPLSDVEILQYYEAKKASLVE
ncbi:MAG: hypothetical protein DRP79_07795 [Planctomycetota bacterium]|nr:MAG: hypothetical protein DRP79_07795 [Planctomycetota bacterium]